MDTEKIVVLIPAHNEEKTIGKLISQVKKIIPKVYVVDDGSTD
ncbi:MAG: glycosyltransferase, partial [Candidatus Omnitrophica bacterium]|nr:glycosyltransferase [Candidatus Omnitrophota bacterium]